jgi:hypothetical protein
MSNKGNKSAQNAAVQAKKQIRDKQLNVQQQRDEKQQHNEEYVKYLNHPLIISESAYDQLLVYGQSVNQTKHVNGFPGVSQYKPIDRVLYYQTKKFTHFPIDEQHIVGVYLMQDYSFGISYLVYDSWQSDPDVNKFESAKDINQAFAQLIDSESVSKGNSWYKILEACIVECKQQLCKIEGISLGRLDK